MRYIRRTKIEDEEVLSEGCCVEKTHSQSGVVLRNCGPTSNVVTFAMVGTCFLPPLYDNPRRQCAYAIALNSRGVNFVAATC